MDGFINLYKQRGFTSHDCVAVVRKLTQSKTGHAGTLDPEAEGVLPICLGLATRLADYVACGDKAYRAVIAFGTATDTQDAAGAVIAAKPVTAGRAEAEAAIQAFVGEYNQTPPMYSALKHNGQKLYDLARKGVEVPRAPRPVCVTRIDADLTDYPETAVLSVVCSKGTYIRTLCADIGERLGGAAHMRSLTRARVGSFALESAVTLDELRRDVPGALIPIEAALPAFARVSVTAAAAKLLANGNPIPVSQAAPAEPGKAFIYAPNGRLGGLYELTETADKWRPIAIFPIIQGAST